MKIIRSRISIVLALSTLLSTHVAASYYPHHAEETGYDHHTSKQWHAPTRRYRKALPVVLIDETIESISFVTTLLAKTTLQAIRPFRLISQIFFSFIITLCLHEIWPRLAKFISLDTIRNLLASQMPNPNQNERRVIVAPQVQLNPVRNNISSIFQDAMKKEIDWEKIRKMVSARLIQINVPFIFSKCTEAVLKERNEIAQKSTIRSIIRTTIIWTFMQQFGKTKKISEAIRWLYGITIFLLIVELSFKKRTTTTVMTKEGEERTYQDTLLNSVLKKVIRAISSGIFLFLILFAGNQLLTRATELMKQDKQKEWIASTGDNAYGNKVFLYQWIKDTIKTMPSSAITELAKTAFEFVNSLSDLWQELLGYVVMQPRKLLQEANIDFTEKQLTTFINSLLLNFVG